MKKLKINFFKNNFIKFKEITKIKYNTKKNLKKIQKFNLKKFKNLVLKHLKSCISVVTKTADDFISSVALMVLFNDSLSIGLQHSDKVKGRRAVTGSFEPIQLDAPGARIEPNGF